MSQIPLFLSGKSCNDIGYVIGVIHGDGYITPTRLKLEAKDMDFVEAFSKSLTNISGLRLNGRRYSVFPYKRHGTYVTMGGDKNLVIWMKSIKNIYSELDSLLNKNKELSRGFLKGIFDSEGSNTKNSIFFSITDQHLIYLCKALLERHFNIRSNIFEIYQKSNYKPEGYHYWRLAISTRRYMEKYMKEISFSLKRKRLKITKRPSRGGHWTKEELKYIKENQEIHFDREIAENLNKDFGSYRTESSVTHKRQRMGLWREKGWNQTNMK